MIQKAKRYKCGGCGFDEYAIYAQEGNSIDLYTECLKCGSISVVGFTMPCIEIGWYGESDGIMHTD